MGGPGVRAPLVLLAGGGLLTIFLGLPVVVLVSRALIGENALDEILRDPLLARALGISVLTTAISLVLTVSLGTPLAYSLATRSLPAGGLLETVVDLPILLPPAVAGLALLLLFGRRGPLGGVLDALGLDLAFTTGAVILAQVFVSAPLFVRNARDGFRGVGREVVEAARVDGATDWAVFRLVMVPLAARSLGSGAVLAWVRSLGEFGATILFAGNIEGRTQTLPLLIYATFETSLGASIASAAILVIVVVGVLVTVRLARGPGDTLVSA